MFKKTMMMLMALLLAIIPTIGFAANIWTDDFETNKGWVMTGTSSSWARGTPTGGGTTYIDPVGAHGGTYVIGNNMSGNYNASENSACTSPSFSCNGYYGVTLSFYRWLGVETVTYDTSRIWVSNNGTTWTEVYRNPSGSFGDGAWQYLSYDLSAVADNQATVYVRFGLRSDGSVQYCGWNIDDLTITGSNTPDVRYTSYSIGGDGLALPGETSVPLTVTLKNSGAAVNSVAATLSTADPYITVQATNNPYSYGNMAAGASASNSASPYYFNVSSSAPNGYSAKFKLAITGTGYSNNDSFYVFIGNKAWNIMTYLDGDNSLNSFINGDCDEMEYNGGRTTYDIIVEVDGSSSGYADAGGTHTDTRRYLISAGNTSDSKINSGEAVGSPNAELDMGNWQTLRDFGLWGTKNYPAGKYWLNLWDHGNSMTKSGQTPNSVFGFSSDNGIKVNSKDFCNDDNSGTSIHFANAEPPSEYENALMVIKDSLKRDLDVVSFDACLMAMAEIMFITKDYADIQVSSERSIPGAGYNYNTFLDTLRENSGVDAKGLALNCVKSYSLEYPGESNGATLSAVELKTRFMEFIKALDNFARELIKAGGRTNTNISSARSSTESYDNADDIDLWHFASLIKQKAALPQSLKDAADTLRAKMGYDKSQTWHSNGQGPILYEWHNSQTATDSAHGITVYYPSALSADTTIYKRHRMSKATLWDEFICGRVNANLAGITSLSYERYQKTTTGGSWQVKDNGNGNGYPDINETNAFYPVLRNSGGQTATGVSVKLRLKKNILNGITITDSTASFANIGGGTKNSKAPTTGVASDSLVFTVANNSALASRWVDFELVITSNEGTKSVTFPVQVGVSNPLNPLAVKMSQYSALAKDDGIEIAWQTACETNCLRWGIERAENANDGYTEIASLPVNGNSNTCRSYSYTDKSDLREGTYYYRLTEIGTSGDKTCYGPMSVTLGRGIPSSYMLANSSPNPTRGGARISFAVKKGGITSLKIYNITGQAVKTLVNDYRQAGYYTAPWDGRDDQGQAISSGIYFYKLVSGGFSGTKKMMILK